MAKARGLVAVNVEECKGCKLCVEACPVNVLHLSDGFNTHGYSPADRCPVHDRHHATLRCRVSGC